MNYVLIELPAEALPASAREGSDFAEEARFLLALKLFELGRLSSGKAAQLCGMGRVEFLLAAGRAGVPAVTLTDGEMQNEFGPDA